MTTDYPNGITSFGMPVIGSGGVMTTGGVYFVDSGATNATTGNVGSKTSPMSTIESAIDLCTANNGDVIFVMPGHAQTVTTALALDVAGVRIVGLGWGRSIPAITPSGAIDCVTVTAANCWLENVRIIGQSADSTASINIAADDFTCVNCVIEQGATPVIGVTVASGNRFRFSGCSFMGTAAGPDVAIDFESSAPILDWVVEDCTFNYIQSVGLDLAGIRASKKQSGGLVKNCDFIGMDVTAIDINSSVNALCDGLIVDNRVGAITAVANIDTLIDAGGYLLMENYGTDLPAETGGVIPVTSAA